MSFAINQVTMIILHQRRILPDRLPGSFDKQYPEEIITSKGNSSGVSRFSAFPYPGNKTHITSQVINMGKPVNITNLCYQGRGCQRPYSGNGFLKIK